MTLRTELDARLSDGAAEIFDAFMASSRFAAYQQSRAWAQSVPTRGRQDMLIFRCLDGDSLIAGAIVRRTRLGRHAWLATVQRGPIVHDRAAFAPAIALLKARLRAEGCCSLQLTPRMSGRDLAEAAEVLRDAGFVALPPDRQPLHVATGMIDLRRGEDEILAGFKQRGRRQIRAAEKAGIVVRHAAGAADVTAFQAMLDRFRAARPDYDMAGLPDAAGQALLVDRLGGAMLLAEQGGEVIGAHAFVRQADEAIWLSLATIEDGGGAPRSYPLLWAAMREARKTGLSCYDLAGLPLAEARDAGEAGRVQFKTAFAPEKRVLLPMFIIGLKPLEHALLFGARQLYRGSMLRIRMRSHAR